jgi:uncharacterized membrane protein (UPF0127 family)
MELRRLCAYNQTRECFLGLEVSVADVAPAVLESLFRKLSLKSDEGLWITPFRGMPDTDMRNPLDLIYLDDNCRVIEVVEPFATFRVSPSSPRASSVLALPIHSIYSSQTRAGDQLVLCLAEEMQGLPECFSNIKGGLCAMAAEWINRRKEELKQKEQAAKISAAQDRLATETIRIDGPVYWDSLLPELNRQCSDMEDLGYQANAYSLDNPFCPEEKTYRIDVQTKGHWPFDAHASLIHFTGSSIVKVSSSIPKLTEIFLSVTERGIRAISNKDMSQMDVKALAAYLLEGLVETIEKERRTASSAEFVG